jgi:glycosyltransferase involved in cell wall biosynthesis
MKEEGIETRVISFRRLYLAWLYPGKSDKDPSKHVVKVNAEYILDPIYPWTWLKAAYRAMTDQSDLVLIQWWTTFWAIPFGILMRILRHKKQKVSILVHNVLPHEQKIWDKPLATWALSASQGFITQTQAQKEILQSLLPGVIVDVCPIPTYSMFSGERFSQVEARRLLGLPSERIILLFFGFIRPYKGLKCLLEAMSKIPENRRPLLVVAGEFWENREQYMEQIRRLRLSNDVRIDARYILNEEVPKFFLAADALIAPYIDGTQSAVASIAIGYGMPMIVSDVVAHGISPENLDKTLVFPAGDVEAMTKAIQQFVDSPREEQALTIPLSNEWKRMLDTIKQLATRLNQARSDK